MTTTELVSDLVVRGVVLVANGDKLRFQSPRPLTQVDVERLRQHKAPLLRLLRAEGLLYRHPAADPSPREQCDRCGSTDFIDVSIHGGRSLRRDCSRCRRFLGWPRWYDEVPDGGR